MYQRDKENMTFMMDDVNYFYEVMPFDLKNAKVIYQKVMNMVFKGLIEQNVKVYVDDMVVKSKSCMWRISVKSSLCLK